MMSDTFVDARVTHLHCLEHPRRVHLNLQARCELVYIENCDVDVPVYTFD